MFLRLSLILGRYIVILILITQNWCYWKQMCHAVSFTSGRQEIRHTGGADVLSIDKF